MGLSMVRSDRPARFYPEVVRVSLWLVVGLWLARRLARLIVLILRSPTAVTVIVLAASGTAGWRLVSPALPLGVVAGLVAVLVVWRWRWPVSFEKYAYCRARGWLRGGWVYRRRWTTAMDTAGLTKARHGTTYAPPLLRVRSTRTVDRVRVRMLAGQTIEDFGSVADRLARTFGAVDCRVRSIPRRRHHLELWLLIADPLEQVVRPFPPAPDCLTNGIPVARAEDGSIYRLHVVGHHLLVAGATGSGKGSVISAIIGGLVDQIAAGLVALWVIDPKGGMELAGARHLFARFAYGDATADGGYEASLAQLLEDAVQAMRERQDRLRGVTRLHTPSVAEPLIVLIVDEIAALTAWVNDRTTKRRIETALGLLLSQGRAVGVVVVGAVQDPRKDVIPQRDLFPTRAALRLNEAEHVTLVLGPGARNRGAYCDLIPDSLPGVGYLMVDGIAEPVRVRFCYYTDDDIAGLGRQLPPSDTPDRPGLVLIKGTAA
jgi:S-DNA-T family DNA segregation ATPase FtsK/SpoIIIE